MIRDIPEGIVPTEFKVDGIPTLLIKATKELILTAKMNQGFLIYIVPILIGKINTFSLMSAFFENMSEALFIYSPLFDDPTNPQLFEIIFSRTINVYFFDEHCRPLLGYTATVSFPPESEKMLKNATFLPLELSLVPEFSDKMLAWFEQSGPADDRDAISISFGKPLIPEDIFIQDSRHEKHSYHGTSSVSHTTLIREKPGAYQERDIVQLLQKIFKPEYIYLNPLKTTDRKEIVDVLVCTPTNILLIQAKDSPNTESILKNDLTRKKATALKNLKKAVKQTRGAMRYIRAKTHIDMILENKEYHLEIGNRKIRTLVIVKELFDDEFAKYSSELNLLIDSAPCIALAYTDFVDYTYRLADENSFFKTYDKVYDDGIHHGEFSCLRVFMPDNFLECLKSYKKDNEG